MPVIYRGTECHVHSSEWLPSNPAPSRNLAIGRAVWNAVQNAMFTAVSGCQATRRQAVIWRLAELCGMPASCTRVSYNMHDHPDPSPRTMCESKIIWSTTLLRERKQTPSEACMGRPRRDACCDMIGVVLFFRFFP